MAPRWTFAQVASARPEGYTIGPHRHDCMTDLKTLFEGPTNGDAIAGCVVDIARAIVLVLDPTGRILYYNRFLEELSGMPLRETRGEDWFSSFLPERDHSTIQQLFDRALAGEPVVDNVNSIVTHTGAEREIEWSGTVLRSPNGQAIGVLSVGIDVTDRNRLERRTRLQAELVDQVSDAIISTDPEGRIETWNRAAERIFGYSLEEALGQSLGELLRTDYGETTREQTLRELAARRRWSGEVVQRHKDGSPRHIQSNVSLTRDGEGKVRGMVGVNRDVSDRVHAEQRLRDSERRYRAIFEQRHQLAGLLRVDGIVLDANQRALDLVGATREQVVGRYFWDTPWWSHSPKLQMRLRSAIEHAASGATIRFEAQHPRADGEWASVDFSIRPLFDETGRVELLIPESVDITDRRRLELQLMDQERLAAIGTTAAMFAHEIANPLNGMALHGALLKKRLGKLQAPEAITRSLDCLLDEVRRLDTLLGEFRTLARRQTFEFECVDLRALVDDVLLLHVGSSQSSGVHIEKELPMDLPRVMGSPNKLKQVLVNLCKNALEAMPDGGMIRLSASHTSELVSLCISDTGTGIPEVIDVFQPFETTKQHGTGLGLPIARQIIRAHGGDLVYESKVGQGTTFVLSLPLADDQPNPQPTGESATPHPSLDNEPLSPRASVRP